MSMADKIKAQAEANPRQPSLQNFLHTLETEDAQAVIAAIADPSVPLGAIRKVLLDEGFRITNSALSQHRCGHHRPLTVGVAA